MTGSSRCGVTGANRGPRAVSVALYDPFVYRTEDAGFSHRRTGFDSPTGYSRKAVESAAQPARIPMALTAAPIAQLDRASVYGTEGCWFESSAVRFITCWNVLACGNLD